MPEKRLGLGGGVTQTAASDIEGRRGAKQSKSPSAKEDEWGKSRKLEVRRKETPPKKPQQGAQVIAQTNGVGERKKAQQKGKFTR